MLGGWLLTWRSCLDTSILSWPWPYCPPHSRGVRPLCCIFLPVPVYLFLCFGWAKDLWELGIVPFLYFQIILLEEYSGQALIPRSSSRRILVAQCTNLPLYYPTLHGIIRAFLMSSAILFQASLGWSSESIILSYGPSITEALYLPN